MPNEPEPRRRRISKRSVLPRSSGATSARAGRLSPIVMRGYPSSLATPKCFHLGERSALQCLGQASHEDLPVALGADAAVEDRDDAAIASRADEPPEALLERQRRRRDEVSHERRFALLLEALAAGLDERVARHVE